MKDVLKSTPVQLMLTPAQAADVLAISPRKLWAMTRAAEVPHVRFGRAVRYPIEALERWIAEQTHGS